MMNKQKGDGAETPVTPGDAGAGLGTSQSSIPHTHRGIRETPPHVQSCL